MNRRLIRKKLSPFVPWGEMIPRPVLEARLEAAVREGQHAAIFASTGYGKTTLVAKWCKDLAPAWVTLDAEDADLDVFLAYLISAFERALESFDTEARGMLGRAREREGAMAALSVLLADLDEQCDRPLVLILDDYHLAASPSLDALVARLLKYLPEPIRLVLVSRQQPDIGLAALQARRRVLVLGETELRFGTDELRSLRPDLDDQGIASLLETTGGWPAAMGMPPELLEAFLEEQVLSPQPPEVRYLLQRLALVDVFDADLCESALHVPLTQERRSFLLQHRLILPHGE
ncbi:MAG: AAA family ATPase, partial [Candidatus Sericytochromatia bacterium]